MIRSTVGFIAALGIACVAGLTFNDLPPEYRDMLPSTIRTFLGGLSESDRATLREVAKNFQNEQQAIAAVKAKSPKLGAELEKFYEMGKKKIDALTPQARSFVESLYSDARKMFSDALAGHKPTAAQLKAKTQAIISKYDALPDAAKADIQKEFPTLSALLKNKELPNKLANIHIPN